MACDKSLQLTSEQESVQRRNSEDQLLIQKVKRGDKEAFQALVMPYKDSVFRVARQITRHRQDAEDVVQETLLQAYRHLDSFEGGSKFSTWLVRIAVNESLMSLRRRRGIHVSLDQVFDTEEGGIIRELADARPNPEEHYLQSEFSQKVRSAVDRLPKLFRSVFILRHLQELTTEETALKLRITVPAVKARVHRAGCHLREKGEIYKI